ncbi:MAG: hypothetical protein B6D37_05775 [Sphingobacteriales bacterium UTBCD1]|nr:MAG: hypothetical protein B6D37_05775 [Sphingobacteriales bacterium UTBCD1]
MLLIFVFNEIFWFFNIYRHGLQQRAAKVHEICTSQVKEAIFSVTCCFKSVIFSFITAYGTKFHNYVSLLLIMNRIPLNLTSVKPASSMAILPLFKKQMIRSNPGRLL